MTQNPIEKLRKEKGLSQFDLAVIAGVYPSTIHYYETGKQIPKVDVAQKIAAALGVSIEEIWPTEKVA